MHNELFGNGKNGESIPLLQQYDKKATAIIQKRELDGLGSHPMENRSAEIIEKTRPSKRSAQLLDPCPVQTDPLHTDTTIKLDSFNGSMKVDIVNLFQAALNREETGDGKILERLVYLLASSLVW